MPEKHKRFINCRIARKDGTISEGELCVLASGKIVDNFEDEVEVEIVDIQGLIIAPGYIDTQVSFWIKRRLKID